MCAAGSALYFGLLEGDVCGCGDDHEFFTKERMDGICDLPCPGNEWEMCGAETAYELYELFDGTDPIQSFAIELTLDCTGECRAFLQCLVSFPALTSFLTDTYHRSSSASTKMCCLTTPSLDHLVRSAVAARTLY